MLYPTDESERLLVARPRHYYTYIEECWRQPYYRRWKTPFALNTFYRYKIYSAQMAENNAKKLYPFIYI